MFENLSERLEKSFKLLKGQGRISEINIAETLKEVRRALLDADVNFKIAKQFTDTVKQKAIGQEVLNSVNPSQMMVKIVHDELVDLMGGDKTDINIKINPSIILIAGLQGSGKTTFSGKLAKWVKSKRGKNPLLVACDVYRPAAIEQLKIIGSQIEVPVYTEDGNINPIAIARNAVKEAKKSGYDLVIIDTAGRLAIDEEMMKEISSVKDAVNPNEILFVVDSMTGQDAVNTAREFNERLDFDGVVLTKLDGDTRGGAALSIKSVVNKPIKFVSSGEKMEAIDIFYPERMADRILGMGDIVSLVEKAQEQYDSEEARKLQKRISKDQFDFNDFITQIQQIKKMGNVKDLMAMIPGVGKAVKDLDIDDNAFKGIEAIIRSMTPEERTNPVVLNGSRRKRIASGSGTSVQEVNKLLKQFDETKRMMKMMTKGGNVARLMGQKIIFDMYKIIDGKKVASEIRKEIAEEVAKLKTAGKKIPHLAAILVGNNGSSETYVANKVKDCEEVGFKSTLIRYGSDISEAVLLSKIAELNNDQDIDGFIVQLPLPDQMSENKVIEAIDPAKDADGFHPVNIGKMVIGLSGYLPATPYGIVELIKRYGIETSGKNCVVIGRSNIVGRPVSILLSQKGMDATVTVVHSRTKNIKNIVSQADIIIAAIGSPGFVKADMVKEGAVVIDVGATRIISSETKSGFRLVGDVDFEKVAPKCSFITPVPGGVGPMTRVSLLRNTLVAAKRD